MHNPTHNPTHGPQIVFETTQRSKCLEARLVLEATGISSKVVRQDQSWLLVVRGDDVIGAQAELEAYRQEIETQSRRKTSVTPGHRGAVSAAVVYAAVILNASS